MMEIVYSDSIGKLGLAHETITEMLTPQVAINDRVAWGLGWGVQHHKDGSDSIWHHGRQAYFRAFAVASISKAFGFVALANSKNGEEVIEEIVRRTVGSDQPAFDAMRQGL